MAFPDTLVGTDSHTPHVDALGVIAIGVGGLEAENVMLGRASWMRLPDIVGVELTGKPQPGITATDIVLALTEFLRKEKVVGAYLEFFGEGAAALTLGDRATISNMAPEYGATAAMFSIDEQTIDYLRLTGRDDAQVRAGGDLREAGRPVGRRAARRADYERTLRVRPVQRSCATWPARRTRTSALPTVRPGRARHRRRRGRTTPGQMPDGAVIIAAITSCTNTSNPRNVIAAGLLARNANARGPHAQAVGEVARWRRARRPCSCTWRKPACCPSSRSWASASSRFACTTCNGMSGALDPAIQQEIIDRDLYATAVLSGNRNFDGRIHPYAKQAFLASPPLVVAYAIAGTIRFDIEKDVLGIDANGQPGPLKDIWPERRRDRRDRRAAASSPSTSARSTSRCSRSQADAASTISPLYDWRPQSTYIRRPPYWEGALAGERTLRGMRPLAVLPRQHHHRPPVAVQRDHAGQRGRRVPARRWACRRRTSTPTPRTAATT